jgi:hypothetical protein
MAIQGPIPVRFGDVFPHGVYAVAVEPVRDFDKSTKTSPVQALTDDGQRLWAVEILDLDPLTRAADRSVKVKIPAAVQPVLPEELPGIGLRPVEFDGLTVRPYVNQQTGRLAYSYSAKAVRAPGKAGTGSAGGAAPTSGKGAAA